MAPRTTGVSKRMGLAIATAVTGVVVAAGVSLASLVGWVRPAQAVSNTVPANTLVATGLSADTSATPQIVLVPIAPVTTSAQPPATIASLAGSVSSNQTSEHRQEPHGVRDDD
jgi:hypothetical protein